jgi:riboflavin kinase/FMN adenylyltransferase
LGHIFVGQDFVFGHKRSGSLGLIDSMCREFGFSATGLPPVRFDDNPVSSTRIRTAIRAGDFTTVDSLLGRPYTLSGPVVMGDQIGRTLGFPTANLDVPNLTLPPHGVYAVHASIDGTQCNGVLNIGLRPTLDSPAPQLRVEAHLLDFEGDLYGRDIDLSFIRKLRDEKRFDSLSALQAQIASDIAEARAIFA